MGRESIFQKVLNVVGFSDINFESNPEFSKKFCLKGQNEAAIRQLFTPEVQRFFTTNTLFSHVESNGTYLIFLGEKMGRKPEDLREYLVSAKKLEELLNSNASVMPNLQNNQNQSTQNNNLTEQNSQTQNLQNTSQLTAPQNPNEATPDAFMPELPTQNPQPQQTEK